MLHTHSPAVRTFFCLPPPCVGLGVKGHSESDRDALLPLACDTKDSLWWGAGAA